MKVHCIEGVRARHLCRVPYIRLPPCEFCRSVFKHALPSFSQCVCPDLWLQPDCFSMPVFLARYSGCLAGGDCLLESVYMPVTTSAVVALSCRAHVQRQYCARACAATPRTHTGLVCHQAADKLAILAHFAAKNESSADGDAIALIAPPVMHFCTATASQQLRRVA